MLKVMQPILKKLTPKMKLIGKTDPKYQFNKSNGTKWFIGIAVFLGIFVLITIIIVIAYYTLKLKGNSNTKLDIFKASPKNTKNPEFELVPKSALTVNLIESNQGQCFGTGGTYKTESECTGSGGTWDTPCQTDTDCPYFEANKNYPNRRGTCKYGYCELPLGCDSKFRTFRTCGNQDQPQCYNCKNGFEGFGSIGECCKDQSTFTALNSLVDCQFDDIYKCLVSADYAYSGDTQDRLAKEFRKGLTADRKRT
jgi:hypothetical protein